MMYEDDDSAQPRYEELITHAGASISAEAKARVKCRARELIYRSPDSGKEQNMSTLAYDSRMQIQSPPSRLLAAGVLMALAAGLFAMVSHQPGQQTTPSEHSNFAAAAPAAAGPVSPPIEPRDDDDVKPESKRPTIFDTPEAAIKALLEALSAGDVASMEALLHSRAGVEGLCGAENIKLLEQKDKSMIEKFKQNGKTMSDTGLQVKYADDKKESGTISMGVVTLPLGVKKTDKGWTLTAPKSDAQHAVVAEKAKPNAEEVAQIKLLEAQLAAVKARLGMAADEKKEDGTEVETPAGKVVIKHAPIAIVGGAFPVLPGGGVGAGGVRVRGGMVGGVGPMGVVPAPKASDPEAAPAPAKELTADERKELEKAIQDLGSEDFNTRDGAKKRLKNAGASAKELLESGTKSDDAERAHACTEMLEALAGGQKKSDRPGHKVIQGGDGNVTWTIETDEQANEIFIPLPPVPVPDPVQR
jgi:hypothetical protein